MAQWRREADTDLVALAAAVPDAVAVVDDAGGLVGWDESNAHFYLKQNGICELMQLRDSGAGVTLLGWNGD